MGTCGAPALIPADHSREALGALAAPCSLAEGHSGDHGNGLATWEREDLDTAVIRAAEGDYAALGEVMHAIVPFEDTSEYAESVRVWAWAEVPHATTFDQVREVAEFMARSEVGEAAA